MEFARKCVTYALNTRLCTRVSAWASLSLSLSFSSSSSLFYGGLHNVSSSRARWCVCNPVVLTDTIVGFIFIIHLFDPFPMDGRQAYTRNPVFLCCFNQIKPRNAKNRRTLNQPCARFYSFLLFAKRRAALISDPRHPCFVAFSFLSIGYRIVDDSLTFIFPFYDETFRVDTRIFAYVRLARTGWDSFSWNIFCWTIIWFYYRNFRCWTKSIKLYRAIDHATAFRYIFGNFS